MNNTINTILTGTIGVAGVQATEVVASSIPTPEEVTSITQILLQVVIGILTIWKLVKKPRKNEP